MDLMTAITVWAFITLLLIFIVGMFGFAAMFIYKGKPEAQAVTEEAPVEEPLPMSVMEPEYIQELRSITPTQFKQMYMGDWVDQQQEEE